MNYIVLNGMKSTLIKGLLISELPPITKPLIRTKTEEIDGRDGDIITKLGYAAYDKKMSIGLYGDFNIDDIIQYFDSAGTVVFSNEPDKVYRYQIINQIDFERLLRFRKATVTLHVQPFKFSSVDDNIELSNNALQSFEVINRGNVVAKPAITLYGTGAATLTVNNKTVSISDISILTPIEANKITLNVETMNADTTGFLRNRDITGDLSELAFQIGRNTLSYTGDIDLIKIERGSRWI
jgi:predicted phage tail component-like protein